MATPKKSLKIKITIPDGQRVTLGPSADGTPRHAKNGDILAVPDDLSKQEAGILAGVNKAVVYTAPAKKKASSPA